MVLGEVTTFSPFQSQMPEPTGPNKEETKGQRAGGGWVEGWPGLLAGGDSHEKKTTNKFVRVECHGAWDEWTASHDGPNESQRAPNEAPLSSQQLVPDPDL